MRCLFADWGYNLSYQIQQIIVLSHPIWVWFNIYTETTRRFSVVVFACLKQIAWNPKMDVLRKLIFLFNLVIFRFHGYFSGEGTHWFFGSFIGVLYICLHLKKTRLGSTDEARAKRNWIAVCRRNDDVRRSKSRSFNGAWRAKGRRCRVAMGDDDGQGHKSNGNIYKNSETNSELLRNHGNKAWSWE